MKTVQRLLPFITLIILVATLSIATPHFLTATNLSSVVRQTAVFNIMALGMTLILWGGTPRRLRSLAIACEMAT